METFGFQNFIRSTGLETVGLTTFQTFSEVFGFGLLKMLHDPSPRVIEWTCWQCAHTVSQPSLPEEPRSLETKKRTSPTGKAPRKKCFKLREKSFRMVGSYIRCTTFIVYTWVIYYVPVDYWTRIGVQDRKLVYRGTLPTRKTPTPLGPP